MPDLPAGENRAASSLDAPSAKVASTRRRITHILIFAGLGPLVSSLTIPAITRSLAWMGLLSSRYIMTYQDLFGIKSIPVALLAIYLLWFVPFLITGIVFALLNGKDWRIPGTFFLTVLVGLVSSAIYVSLLGATGGDSDSPEIFGPWTISFGLAGAAAAAICWVIALYYQSVQARRQQTE